MQYVTNPFSLPLFYCLYNIPLFLANFNNTSFLTQPVQLIFYMFLQIHSFREQNENKTLPVHETKKCRVRRIAASLILKPGIS